MAFTSVLFGVIQTTLGSGIPLALQIISKFFSISKLKYSSISVIFGFSTYFATTVFCTIRLRISFEELSGGNIKKLTLTSFFFV